MSLIIECNYLTVFQFYLKKKKILRSIYFYQSQLLLKTLHISILDTYVGLLPPTFWTLPHNLFDTKEHKVVIQLEPIKNQKLNFGQHTKGRLNTLRLTSKT